MDKKVPICESFCMAWYNTCKESYFSEDSLGRLSPCARDSLVCWLGGTMDPVKFCEDFGFSVVIDSFDGEYCYNGREKAVDVLGNGPKILRSSFGSSHSYTSRS
eukprot:Protomagalhaensia_sp_Gyna_25__5504@NODE_736_length_2729_cov_90_123048_g575_i0_p5_GENE_NODE_736_length_2729_cov_90_123048_g575_i0NODE_736_length_2729_cov_90_123048_g575_i0_p5_ORF_typecomplete_len104_score3_61Folate_rec/PF03024_14/6e07_NODE_736_length_2729_cov_90_123048_g575_i0373684